MKMKVKSTGAELTAVWFDKDAVECNRLNARTKHRLAMIERAKQQRIEFRREMERNANRILVDAVIAGAVSVAGGCGLIHPALWVPIAILSACAACVRLGVWLSKAVGR